MWARLYDVSSKYVFKSIAAGTASVCKVIEVRAAVHTALRPFKRLKAYCSRLNYTPKACRAFQPSQAPQGPSSAGEQQQEQQECSTDLHASPRTCN